MSIELLYTSAPQGLKPSSRGFCTVLSTTGMPVNLATRLEGLSAYRHAFPPNTPEAAQNPVCYSHLKMTVGGQRLSVLSRIADYGVDYSQRTNKIAHHVVVSAGEQVPAGPAWAMLQSRVMRAQWDGQCATPAAGPTLHLGNQAPAICAQWAALTGEAGWGAILAEALAQSVGKPTWIVFSLEQSPRLLGLINEAIALLPERERWQATFSTYLTNLPPDVDCRLRCVLAGTDEARLAPARGTVIDLTQPLPPPASNRFTQIAVEGSLVAPTNDSMASNPSTVANTAIHSVLGAGGAADSVLNSDEDEIEYLDDDDSPPLNTGTFDHNTPPPPPIRKPPKLQPGHIAVGSPQQRNRIPQRLYLFTAIAACLLLMAGVGIYLAVTKQPVKVVGLATGLGTGPEEEKIADEEIPRTEITEESGENESDAVKTHPENTPDSQNLQTEVDASESSENATDAPINNFPASKTEGDLTDAQGGVTKSVTQDTTTPPPELANTAAPILSLEQVAVASSDAKSPEPNIAVSEIPGTLSPEADDGEVKLTISATIDARWFDGNDKKITATGKLALRESWLDKTYFSEQKDMTLRRFQVEKTVKTTTANDHIKNLRMTTPTTMVGTVTLENGPLTSERDTLKQKTALILRKVNEWNEVAAQNLSKLDLKLRNNNEGGLIIPVPPERPGLSLDERSDISNSLQQAGAAVKLKLEELKKSDEKIRSQLDGQYAFVELKAVGLADLEQMNNELNKTIDRIRRLCIEVDDKLGVLLYLAEDNGKSKKPGTLVTLTLELSADKKEQ